MIIPAAGLGSRLGVRVPKVLVEVAGMPMIDHLLGLYGSAVQRFVVVVGPSGHDLVAGHLSARREAAEIVVQPEPTGMLDAVLLALDAVRRHEPDRVWITWCDQLAVCPDTVARLVAAEVSQPEPAMVVPTCEGPDPYIHFERDAAGRIVAVRQCREGDVMPPVGESDMGLFSLSRTAYLEDLEAYDQAAGRGQATKERNFLPFIPWLAARRRVLTVPCSHPIEAVGINTPEELRRVETHLQGLAGRLAPGGGRAN